MNTDMDAAHPLSPIAQPHVIARALLCYAWGPGKPEGRILAFIGVFVLYRILRRLKAR
jgi:hypothetical protein